MPHAKRLVLAAGAGLALLVVAALVLPPLVGIERFRPRVEAAASTAVGLQVRLAGRLGLSLVPGPRISAEDVRVLGARESTLVAARTVRAWLDPFPLLVGRIRLRRIEVVKPSLTIEHAPEAAAGAVAPRATPSLAMLNGASLVISDGAVRYSDPRTGVAYEATGIECAIDELRFAAAGRDWPPRRVSLRATLRCARFTTGALAVTALECRVDGRDGVLEIAPVTLTLFGGRATGRVRADLSGAVPGFGIRADLAGFRVEELLRTLTTERSAEGAMNFSARLSMRGATVADLVRSAAGEASLRGRDLVLHGSDLDRDLSRFESSRNLNLVDLGAVFFAGPVGLAVTRGFTFARLFRGSGKSSAIPVLVSNWTVAGGVASARDVAMTTRRNRLALQGRLDFASGTFGDVSIAVVDAKGCAIVRQAVHGSFANPVVDKPRVLGSLTTPMVGLYRQARRLLPSGPCTPFYTGSVAPPD
jgi:AsmA protein